MRAAAEVPRHAFGWVGFRGERQNGDGLAHAALTRSPRRASVAQLVRLVRWNRYRLTPQAKMASPLRNRPMRTCSPSASPPGTRRSPRQPAKRPTPPPRGAAPPPRGGPPLAAVSANPRSPPRRGAKEWAFLPRLVETGPDTLFDELRT